MPSIEFSGSRELINALDAAVCNDCPVSITDALRDSLCHLMRNQLVSLPNCVLTPFNDRYARRELYRSQQHGYSVIAMTWGPGQGTPIHDHSGMWCVEGVWHGALEITPYDLIEQNSNSYRFKRCETLQADTGSAGSLIPPHDYHTIQNVSLHTTAVSLHIYRGPMTTCSAYYPTGNDWYERQERQLCSDEVH